MSDDLQQHGTADHSGDTDGLISYAGMIARIAMLFPDVPIARIEAIAFEEHEVISGGQLYMVPALVEVGTVERLVVMAVSEGSTD
jgi:voltage-gated potassium channel Kch